MQKLFAVIAAAPLLLTACEPDNADSMDSADSNGDDSEPRICDGETRDDFSIGVMRKGSAVDVSIMDAMPADPIRGDNGWILAVNDASGGVEGVTIEVSPWMPDHGHGTPVPPTITEMGGGDYQISPLNLFMAGLWEITFKLGLADGSTDEVMFSVCVE